MGMKPTPFNKAQLAVARAILGDYEKGCSIEQIAGEFELDEDVVELVLAGAAHFRECIQLCYDAVASVEFLADNPEQERRNSEAAQAACDEIVCVSAKYVPGIDGEDAWHHWPRPSEIDPEEDPVDADDGA